MAVVSTNFTLYPPIVDTYMPAFLNTDTCKIYFSLSSYNSLEDIGGLQYIVKRQNNNVTALKGSRQMMSLSKDRIKKDWNESGEVRYYFEINPSDIIGGQFEINTYYKVQIRFIDKDTVVPFNDIDINVWNQKHLMNLSEWSTACLIRGILQPNIYLQNFDTERDTAIASGKETYLAASQVLDIVGRMFFNDANQKTSEGENLKSYQIRVWDADSDFTEEECLDDSGIIYVDQFSNENNINYSIKYNFVIEQSYVMYINFETNNLYKGVKKYSFKIKDAILDALKGKFTLETYNEAGAVKIIFSADDNYSGNISIRRTSSESGFQVWEDVKTQIWNFSQDKELTFEDYTIKSGVFYKYGIQKRSSSGLRGTLLIAQETIEKEGEESQLETTDAVVMIVFDDMFLTRDNKQLRIQFDPQISSFGYQISEAKLDTIGSQFPFIRRNGKMKYREFPISGQITHLSNIVNNLIKGERIREDSCGTKETDYFQEKNLLITKDEFYSYKKKSNYGQDIDIKKDYYDKYNEQYNINNYNDYIWERDYREAVMDFLYDNTAKLFRTTTEGNILVKLTNISFTPNQQLGRLIYNFSATATEVAEPTYNNYIEHGIITGTSTVKDVVNNLTEEMISLTLDLKKQIPTEEEKEQWELDPRPSDVITAITNSLNPIIDTKSFTLYTIQQIKWLKIEFESPTKRIIFKDGVPSVATSIEDMVQKENEQTTVTTAPASSALAYGYIATLNGEHRFINKNGVYEIVDEENLDITSLGFPVDEKIMITCQFIKGEGEDIEQMNKIEYSYQKLAQIDTRISPKHDFIQDIKDKYNILDADFIQQVSSISTLDIEAPTGAVFYLRFGDENEEGNLNKYIIGETGRLRLEDENLNIIEGYYDGILLHSTDNPRPRDSEYTNFDTVLIGENQNNLKKERQLYSLSENSDVFTVQLHDSVENVDSVSQIVTISSDSEFEANKIGYGIIIESASGYYLPYNCMDLFVDPLTDIVTYEDGSSDIHIKPKSDILITFRCELTGKEN